MAVFQPKARLVEILGKHLIKDNTVGLLELVKNAYDADATEVEISLHDLHDPEKTTITIRDNGSGMSLDTVNGAWLEPAHGGKEAQKEKAIKSPLGRLPLGEKGVGRFAAHKLGRYLSLVSRHESSPKEVVLDIDWKPFENRDAYLADIHLHPKERAPKTFPGKSHGTCLVMRHAREKWHETDLRRLHASLQKLKSPKKGVANFDVRLRCPEFPQYETLDSVSILDRAHFSFIALVDADGVVEFDYQANIAGQKSQTTGEKRNIWHEQSGDTSRKPVCGPFYLDLRAWLRKADLLRQAGVTKEQLNAFSGVCIFRDGIRVLPYGEEGDDWLLLDKRRIDDPTRRFANNQIIGTVEIDQLNNRSLIDKANREGLQENDAYRDFRSLVTACVKLIENISAAERNKLTGEKKLDGEKDEVVTTIKQAEDAAKRSQEEARAVTKAIEVAESKGWIQPEVATDLVGKVKTLEGQVADYRGKLASANDTVKEVFSNEEKEREAFLHLVAVGLVAERFTHEFARVVNQLAELFRQLRTITRTDPAAAEAVSDLERQIGILQNELIPLGNLVHRHNQLGTDKCNVPAIVQAVLDNNAPRIDGAKIKVELIRTTEDDFASPMRDVALAQVLDNILDNAIFWLSQRSLIDDRRLRIVVDPKTRTVLLTNNGSPIPHNIRSRLFQKFLTTKVHGRGLGLFICKELMKSSGGDISLDSADSNESCLPGASFLIRVPDDAVTPR